jgi:hypothetical protein
MRFAVALGLVSLAGACGGAPPPTAAEPSGPISPIQMPADATSPSAGITATLDGTSCEQARDAWAEDAAARGIDVPDASADEIAAFGAVLNKGTYLNPCEVPPTVGIVLCVAVLQGEARGVTVKLEGGTKQQGECVAHEAAKLTFPVRDVMSIAKTTFSAQ